MEYRKRFNNTIIMIILLIAVVLNIPPALRADDPLPKNIILFIGDGMGVAHITAAKTVKGKLFLEQFPVGGFITTHASNAYITDSAAGATAIATGFKTYNGAISISPSGDTLKTVLEYAEEYGKSTGLVATCSITHATPACFAAHVRNRSDNAAIAEQIAASNAEVLFGGGLGFFLPASQGDSLRKDDKDLVALLKQSSVVITTPEEFIQLGTPDRVVGLFALEHPPAVDQRIISLADMTRKAIDILSKNASGFFLMVEGSQIDWEAHDNESDGIIAETIDFDDAVGIGIEFAKREGQTLIVVTADHETGGYALEGGSVEMKTVTKTGFATHSHTGVMVPLLAFGPASQRFGGIHDNTFVGETLIQLIQLSGNTE
jgi:alkaline phosphatase